MKHFLQFFFAALILISSCKRADHNKIFKDATLYRQTVKKLNDIILINGFPPCIASRNYAYANIAAYEVIAAGDTMNYKSLSGQIKHLPMINKPDKNKTIDFHFASLLAFCKVGNAVTFPEGSMDEYVNSLKEKASNVGMASEVLENSIHFADVVALHILDWSKNDNYAQTRSAPKYTVTNEDGRWIPTPPMFTQALEPHWGEIRPMALNSVEEISLPVDPVPFNIKNKDSQFYKNVMEVKTTGDNLTQEQKDIADFWDDIPLKLNTSGHLRYMTKKFSPGGHWMNIVGIATEMNKDDFNSTVSIYTQTSIALFDAFISCWYLKFKYNYVRPETVINQHIASDWRPYLETPPFPEYTAGHATISSAAEKILTSVIGDNKAFTDTSQVEFGLKARSFKSFKEAATEAGISRVYGGIHYRTSCDEGYKNGQEIGQFVLDRLKLKKSKLANVSR
ncbi:MAG TPA: vanadium-dependent haloperoxidase [Daejeonella sp.]|uniref:vanadium-dependent haloperoxidase n=1 Tax=Daejeonella sp. TaxID=2805397 RepID=UPI002ED98FD5